MRLRKPMRGLQGTQLFPTKGKTTKARSITMHGIDFIKIAQERVMEVAKNSLPNDTLVYIELSN